MLYLGREQCCEAIQAQILRLTRHTIAPLSSLRFIYNASVPRALYISHVWVIVGAGESKALPYPWNDTLTAIETLQMFAIMTFPSKC
jgi:hypothetical protein